MGLPDVSARFHRAIVRIGADEVVGSGLLFRRGRVITCAHVVNAALGRAERAVEAPDRPVRVDFPFSRDRLPLSARVVGWSPVGAAVADDIAVLELDEVPAECAPVPLVRSHRFVGDEFWVLGFPSGHPNGLVATGRLVGRNAARWVQMVDPSSSGPRVRAGFSGAPVWDLTAGGAVGIVVATATPAAEKTAWLIPTELLTPTRVPDRVLPPVLSFGRLTTASRAEGVLDVTAAGGGVTGFHVDPPDGFSATARGGRLVVAVDTTAPGRRSAVVTVATPGGRAEVPALVDVVDEGLREWPTPDGDGARRALLAWAAGRRSVSDRLFSGDLVVRDGSVARLEVTHVKEQRHVSVRSRPGGRDRFESPAVGAWSRVPDDQWVTARVEGVIADSMVLATCPDCDEHHRVTCGTCRGRRAVECPETTRCEVCNGAKQEGATCAACHGRGRVTCAHCSGSGRRPCANCVDGRVGCPRCGASGKYVGYEWERVRRSVATRRTREWPAKPWFAPAARDFVPLAMVGPEGLDLVPPGVRVRLARWLAEEVALWRNGEVMRRVRLTVAPVVAVDYGPGATAYVLGDRVEAPGAVRHGLRTLGLISGWTR